MDMPTAENGMTGVAIGSALTGLRPVMTHQRVDFAILALEQIVNQAAKWHYMFAGEMRVPLCIRIIIGRGWGQGPQHAQSLQAWFAHIPGLKVVMPATPHDAKGLLTAAIEDDGPVVVLEHRWLYNTFGPVPAEPYAVPIGNARVARPGRDVTIVAVSYMVIEALRAAERLSAAGIECEVIDLRSLRPLDGDTVLASIGRTRRLVVCDTGWTAFGVGAEILAVVAERGHGLLACPPRRLGLADCPSPSSPALAKHYYPLPDDIMSAVGEMLGRQEQVRALIGPAVATRDDRTIHLDVPDDSFTGPF
jgi:pyruvate dehydrogenase E1 component beta subunit